MAKSYLRVIILKILSKKEISGYDLVKEIHSITGNWKPSFGSVYPILKDLHKKNLVSIIISGRKKIYKITPYGRTQLNTLMKSKEEIFKTVFSSMKNMELICDKKEIDFINKWHRNFKDNVLPFKELTPEIHELGNLLLTLSTKNLSPAESLKFKKILINSITELKKINECDLKSK